MSKHSWTFNIKDKKATCPCGSWINMEILGTGWEGYATNCFDNECQEEFYEALKQYNSLIESGSEIRTSTLNFSTQEH